MIENEDKYWGSYSASKFMAVCRKMDLIVVGCPKEGEYHKRVARLLAETSR